MKSLLLTGATGYIGAGLVDELLKTTSARIHLVVRPHAEADRSQTLKQKWPSERVHIYTQALTEVILMKIERSE